MHGFEFGWPGKGTVVMLSEDRAVQAGWRKIISPSTDGWDSLMRTPDLDSAGQPSGGGGVRATEVGGMTSVASVGAVLSSSPWQESPEFQKGCATVHLSHRRKRYARVRTSRAPGFILRPGGWGV